MQAVAIEKMHGQLCVASFSSRAEEGSEFVFFESENRGLNEITGSVLGSVF